MVSIKQYLNGTSLEISLRQAVALLVEKIGDSAVEDDPEELDNFRGEISGVRDALTHYPPAENLLILARSAAETLEAYNRRITRSIVRRDGTYQAIIRMFQDGLTRIAGENTACAESLRRMNEEWESGAGFKNPPSLKLHLSNCLDGILETFERERAASKALIGKLQIQVERAQAERAQVESLRPPAGATGRQVDRATELLSRDDCIAAVREAIERGTRHYAVVMIVNRFRPISARLGREAGEWMLARFGEFVASQLPASDRLFHWSGAGVVAILDRQQSFDQVRALVRRMLDRPLQETWDSGGRSVLIPLSAVWSVVVIDTTAEATEKRIQAFAAIHGCPEVGCPEVGCPEMGRPGPVPETASSTRSV
jgi:GGDEF domain-containing protein